MITYDGQPCTNQCRGCPATREAGITRNSPSRVAIVVDFPLDVDHKRDEFLTSDGGKLAELVLNAHGIALHDCYTTSALNCRPADVKKEAMMKNAMLACRDRLVVELQKA